MAAVFYQILCITIYFHFIDSFTIDRTSSLNQNGLMFIFETNNGNICFRYKGLDKEVLNLISDPVNDIYVRGLTSTKTSMDNRHHVIYLSHIGITSGYEQITFKENSMIINDNKYEYGVNDEKIWIGHVTITKQPEYTHDTYLVTLRNGVQLKVVRKNQGHIGVYLIKASGLSSKTNGLLGQFVRSRVFVNSYSNTLTIMKNDVEHMVVNRSNGQMTVPLLESSDQVKCYPHDLSSEEKSGDNSEPSFQEDLLIHIKKDQFVIP